MLQGSLDNFALDEVLGLLSSTSKTGRLELDGDRGTGSVTLRDGELVDAHAPGVIRADRPDDVLFELLRYGSGTFVFTATEVPAEAPTRAVAEVLDAAESRLADFRTIEAVVPSLTHHLTPVETLPADEVTIGRREWVALRSIGSGAPVSAVCEALQLNEIEGSRQVKGLIERGLIELHEPVPTPAPTFARPAQADSGASFLPGASTDRRRGGTGPGVYSYENDAPAEGDERHGGLFGSVGEPTDQTATGVHGDLEVGVFGLPTATSSSPVGLLSSADRLDRPTAPATPPPAERQTGQQDERRLLSDETSFDTHPGEHPIERSGEIASRPPGRHVAASGAADGNPAGAGRSGTGDRTDSLESSDDNRPGGLLMRYLKSDG
jgi:hypothetical protein